MKKKKERKQDKHLIQVPMEQLHTSHISYLQMEIRTMKPPPPSPFNSIKKYMHKPLHIISIQGGDLHNMSLGTTSEQPKKGLTYARPEDTQA